MRLAKPACSIFPWIVRALVASLVAALAPTALAAAPRFAGSIPDTAEAGHVTLSWEGVKLKAGETYEVEHSTMPSFDNKRRIFEGRDESSFVSGLPNGAHYFRVRVRAEDGQTGPWSKPHKVIVKHHSLGLSFGLFGLGAVVFALTVAFVVTNGFSGKPGGKP